MKDVKIDISKGMSHLVGDGICDPNHIESIKQCLGLRERRETRRKT